MKIKGKVRPRTGHEGATSGGWSTPRPGCFTPENNTVAIVQEAGWAQGPVWTGAEKLVPTRIRSSDRQARSESIHRLGYEEEKQIR
jgi:hypothetical protein